MPGRAPGRPATPVHWRVNGLDLAGLSWGKPGERAVLALHGWLDNAASFTRLAPLLTGCHVVALDLTGHGRSARRSADASYQIWDDLPEILGVLELLGWETFDLLGHSRGAIISTLLASAFPERVRRLVLLDAIVPDTVAEDRFPIQLRTALLDKQRLLHKANRTYGSVEEAAASRAMRGLSVAAARELAQRNLVSSERGMEWTTDPRLRGASAVKLTPGQIQAVLSALSMPTLLLLAGETPIEFQQVAEAAVRHVPRLTVRRFDGGHHFHMEACTQEVAQCVLEFLCVVLEPECA